jgi:hypothetical protein
MAFVQKQIRVTLQYANSAAGTASFSGMRTQVKVVTTGQSVNGTASIAIFGMTLDTMNKFTQVGADWTRTDNKVLVEAGDSVTGWAKVYFGNVNLAYMDGNSMPRVAFRIESNSGTYFNSKIADPTSVKGQGDVAQMAQKLAKLVGLTFENNSGVSIKLSNPYLPGTVGTQIATLLQHAGVRWVIENGILAIWPRGTSRQPAGSSQQQPDSSAGQVVSDNVPLPPSRPPDFGVAPIPPSRPSAMMAFRSPPGPGRLRPLPSPLDTVPLPPSRPPDFGVAPLPPPRPSDTATAPQSGNPTPSQTPQGDPTAPYGGGTPGTPGVVLNPPPWGQMIGYPAFNQSNIIVKTLWQPGILYGTDFTVGDHCDIEKARGKWSITGLEVDIDTLVPHGHWEITLTGNNAQSAQSAPSGH